MTPDLNERVCVRVSDSPRFERYPNAVPCADCGALVVHNEVTTSGFRFICLQCLLKDAPPAESSLGPHAFLHPEHCAECNINDPVRWARRERPGWNGHW